MKPFSNIVSELTQCCRDKKTGVFFITTDSNRSAYLTLNQGDIQSVHYMNKRGADALERLRSVEAGTCRFSPGAENALFRSQLLPGTKEILVGLTELIPHGQASGSDKNRVNKKSVNAKSVPKSRPFDDDLIQLLVEFMGPMASVVYSEASENNTNVKTLIKKLATEIPDNYRQNEFVTRAYKLVRDRR